MKSTQMVGDIIDDYESDKDTVDPEELKRQFETYELVGEKILTKTAYIHKLYGTASLQLAAGHTDGNIDIIDAGAGLDSGRRLGAHKDLTELSFSPRDHHLLFSSGLDGVVRLWDTRVDGVAQVYKECEDDSATEGGLLCVDVSCAGRALCAGTERRADGALLVFWDVRNPPAPLGGYQETCADDVTQVRFHPSQAALLATGGQDDLVNVYDIMQSTEDDALQCSINVGNSVERLYWMGAESLWCVTGDEQLRVLQPPEATAAAFTREHIARAIRRSRAEDCHVVEALRWRNDTAALLVADQSCARVAMLRGGSLRGAVRLAAPGAGDRQLRAAHYLAHSDVLLTGGERGELCAWRRTDT